MAGDQISASTKYYYQNAVTNGTGDNLTAPILTALVQSILGSPATGLAKGNSTNISNQLNADALFKTKTAPDANNATGTNPKAYMTIVFFDERFNYVAENSTALRVYQQGNGAAPLVLANIKTPKNGFAYIYLSNESAEPVYFDDFTVSDTRGRIIEEDHYYAYGLKIAGISSKKLGDVNEGLLDNKNLYNDKELIDEADLDWYDYGFRNYDPQIGRFTQLDPLTDDYPELTPYQYASNDPIANIDIDGLEGFNSVQTLQEVVVYAGNVGKSAQSISKLALAASVLKLSQCFINPIPRNISESSCIPCGDQKSFQENAASHFENDYLPKATIGPDNYYVSDEQKAINIHKYSDAGYNPDGSEKFWLKAAKNKTFTNFSNNLALPIITAAVGEGVGKIIFKGAGYFLETSSEGVVNTSEIHFMQSSIKNTTGDYTVLGNAQSLKSGGLNPNVLRMNVWKDANGKIWSLDNRRLAAFKLSGLQEAPIRWTNPNGQMWKMTTTNGGSSTWLKFGNGNGATIR